MRAFVTGHRGFIGSRLVQRLTADGWTVRGCDLVDGFDVRSILPSDLDDVDTVFHLAANADIRAGATNPSLDYGATVEGTFKLLEAMRHAGAKRIVYTSGSGVYGRTWRVSRETDEIAPVSVYGASKAAAEAFVNAYADLHGMSALIVRPANVVGPGVTHGVVYDFVQRLLVDGRKLDVLGNGYQRKAYIHVDDVVDALVTPHLAGTFNLSNEDYLTVRQIATLVSERMGLWPQISYGGATIGWPGDVADVRLDSGKTRDWLWRSLAGRAWLPMLSQHAVLASVDWLLANRRDAA